MNTIAMPGCDGSNLIFSFNRLFVVVSHCNISLRLWVGGWVGQVSTRNKGLPRGMDQFDNRGRHLGQASQAMDKVVSACVSESVSD